MLFSGCAEQSKSGMSKSLASQAVGEFIGVNGKPLGSVTLNHDPSGTRVMLSVHSLPPGEHGVHIHATGTCATPDFTSAGGHWNPTMRHHGSLNPQGAHAGDLPNLSVGADGSGTMETTLSGVELTKGDNPMLDADGAAIVIHAGPDDMKSDPSGNSGGRIACAEIGLRQ